MKKLLVLGLLLLMASTAMAQIDPDPNGIGVFFDQAGTIRCGQATGGMLSVYVIASNISCPGGIGGWEANVTMNAPGLMYLSAVLAGTGPINLYTAPEFQVGLGVPMGYAPNMLLATVNYFVMAGTPGTFFVGPIVHPQSIPGAACYADGADVGHLVPFQPPQGLWTLPAALLNTPCGLVGADPATWGGVKGMFK